MGTMLALSGTARTQGGNGAEDGDGEDGDGERYVGNEGAGIAISPVPMSTWTLSGVVEGPIIGCRV